jgi:hypothetical protein
MCQAADLEMVTIKYDDLSLAFDFVSSGAPTEHRAYVSLDSGKIYWVSELDSLEEEEIPDDLETSSRYLEIPHKNDFDLGRPLVLRFIEARLPHRYDLVADIFHHKGAYRRLKELLSSEGCLEQWYAFEAGATDQALREWCGLNGIHLVGGDEKQSA